MADLKNDPSLKKVPEKFKVIMTEYAENVKKNGMFTGFVYGSQAEQYIRTWNQSDQAQLKAALDEYAAKHNGVLEGFIDLRTGNPLVDPKTGKAPTPDAFLQQLGELSVNHMATAVKTPTLKVGDQKITAIGQPATEEQQKKDEEKKGWFARNWSWFVPTLVAGLGAITGLVLWLVHRNKKRKNNRSIDKTPDNTPVTPTPGGDKDPSGDKDPDNPGKDPDNPGKDPDNPGKDPDNPGKDPDNPGKDPDNPGDDGPSWDSPDVPNHDNDDPSTFEPGASGGIDSKDPDSSSGGTLDKNSNNITGGDNPGSSSSEDYTGDIGTGGSGSSEKQDPIGDPVPSTGTNDESIQGRPSRKPNNVLGG